MLIPDEQQRGAAYASWKSR